MMPAISGPVNGIDRLLDCRIDVLLNGPKVVI